MPIASRIKNLDIRQFFILSRVFLSRPHLILPTFKATAETIKICNTYFGKQHHKDNKTNAYRHALWNYLLCKKSYGLLKNRNKAVNWAKKITDLHEKLAPNEALAELMDLHNNKIGRDFYVNLPLGTTNGAELLFDMMGEAVQVSTGEDIKKNKEKLVYLEKLNA